MRLTYRVWRGLLDATAMAAEGASMSAQDYGLDAADAHAIHLARRWVEQIGYKRGYWERMEREAKKVDGE